RFLHRARALARHVAEALVVATSAGPIVSQADASTVCWIRTPSVAPGRPQAVSVEGCQKTAYISDKVKPCND
ncbi:hypothetical protein, partial [Mycobacterium sp. KBS0706]|uniref:hypothetical protein n=1 Tax=Mycobacterium sp. KBS0706 TaxID=2578109 RepID=UPI001C8F3F46